MITSCDDIIMSSSVLHGYVPEQLGHGLPVVYPPDGLSQHEADVDGLDLAAPLLVNVVHYCVGDQNLREGQGEGGRERGRGQEAW